MNYKLDQKNNDQPTLQDQIPASDLPSPSLVVASSNRKKRLALLLSALMTLAAIGGGIYWTSKHKDPSGVAQPTPQAAPSTQQLVGGVPAQLFGHSQNTRGISVGYLKAPTTASKSHWYAHKAYAETASYQPVAFYTKLATSGQQIFSYDVATKQSKQITTSSTGSSVPVFSSAAQRLAYSEAGCDIVIKDLATNSEKTIQKGANTENSTGAPTDTCYKPTAWSPDGKLLAIGGSYSTNSKELGLVSFTVPYVYDTTEMTMFKVSLPDDFNSMGDYTDALWKDNQQLIVHYVKRGQFGATLKEELDSINIASNKPTKIGTVANSSLTFAQIVGDQLFVTNTLTQELMQGSVTDMDNAKPVNGSKPIGSFLLKAGPDGKPTTIFSLDGSAGQQNSFALNSLPLSGGTKTKIFAPAGYAAYTIGWGKDYDQLVYMVAASQKSELHVYTISENKDEIAVPDLPFIQ